MALFHTHDRGHGGICRAALYALFSAAALPVTAYAADTHVFTQTAAAPPSSCNQTAPASATPAPYLCRFAALAPPNLREQHDVAADLRAARENLPELRRETDSGAAVRKSKDFSVSLAVSATATNGFVSPASDSVSGSKPVLHLNPYFALKWTHQFSWIRLSAITGGNIDRYYGQTATNFGNLEWGAKAAFTDGRNRIFTPYIRYQGAANQKEDLFAHDFTTHEFSAGMLAGWGFGPGGSRKNFSETIDAGDSSIAVDIRAGRRVASTASLQRSFVSASVDVSHNIDDDLTVDFAPNLQARWYEDYFGDVRRDVRLGAELRFDWTPAWLTAVMPGSDVDFRFDYFQNYSNMPGLSYGVWEIGPTFTYTTGF